jgi:hypothetical protein
MNDATQHPIRSYQHTRTKTATAITPTVGRVFKMDAKTKGRKRSTKRQTEICTCINATDGFLKSVFLPKLKTAQSVQACQKKAKMERDFYKSLSKLADHYSIEPMHTHEYNYPYNMILAMWDMKTKLKRNIINSDSLRLVQNSNKTYLVSMERYDTGTNLYHIPMLPLFRMVHDKERKHTTQLLISVCSYLYHIANIPYYRQEDSYLYWLYETHKDWVEQDDETEETECYKSELRKAECIGDKIEQKLFNCINLTLFEQRLSRFESRDTFDKECHKVACNAFALYTEYPNRTIFRNAPMPEEEPCNDDYSNETIGMEKYISFVADTKGYLYENLSENINNEFNEYGSLEEPTICKHFDGSKITATNLDFETRLFTLLEDLCSLLYDYKATEK